MPTTYLVTVHNPGAEVQLLTALQALKNSVTVTMQAVAPATAGAAPNRFAALRAKVIAPMTEEMIDNQLNSLREEWRPSI